MLTQIISRKKKKKKAIEHTFLAAINIAHRKNKHYWNGLVQLAVERTTSLWLRPEEDQYCFHLTTHNTTFYYHSFIMINY